MRQESLQWATTQIEGGIPGEFGAVERKCREAGILRGRVTLGETQNCNFFCHLINARILSKLRTHFFYLTCILINDILTAF